MAATPARLVSIAPGRTARRPGQRLTFADRFRLLELHRAHPEWSSRQLGDAAGVHHETARLACIAASKDVSLLLEAYAVPLLRDWRKASQAAARHGDHRPAKDWLLHAGLIDPLPDPSHGGPQIVVINHSLPGLPEQTVIDAPRPAQNPAAPPAGDDESST